MPSHKLSTHSPKDPDSPQPVLQPAGGARELISGSLTAGSLAPSRLDTSDVGERLNAMSRQCLDHGSPPDRVGRRGCCPGRPVPKRRR